MSERHMNPDIEFMSLEKISIFFPNHFSFKRSLLQHIYTDGTYLVGTSP